MLQANNSALRSDAVHTSVLNDSQQSFPLTAKNHGYCQVHEEEMERHESDSQVVYKCRKCDRSYIELKDTAGKCHKRRK